MSRDWLADECSAAARIARLSPCRLAQKVSHFPLPRSQHSIIPHRRRLVYHHLYRHNMIAVPRYPMSGLVASALLAVAGHPVEVGCIISAKGRSMGRQVGGRQRGAGAWDSGWAVKLRREEGADQPFRRVPEAGLSSNNSLFSNWTCISPIDIRSRMSDTGTNDIGARTLSTSTAWLMTSSWLLNAHAGACPSHDLMTVPMLGH